MRIDGKFGSLRGSQSNGGGFTALKGCEGFMDLLVQGRWIVIGGLGSLGMLTAGWLAGQGHRHITLLGRSGR